MHGVPSLLICWPIFVIRSVPTLNRYILATYLSAQRLTHLTVARVVALKPLHAAFAGKTGGVECSTLCHIVHANNLEGGWSAVAIAVDARDYRHIVLGAVLSHRILCHATMLANRSGIVAGDNGSVDGQGRDAHRGAGSNDGDADD